LAREVVVLNPEVATQVVIQARMGSTRLPGKVLLPLNGISVLGHVVRRAAAAARVDRVVVATSELCEDDRIVEWCRDNAVNCSRGSATDVLARFVTTVGEWPCKTVVRITGDCPAVDPGTVDAVVCHLLDGDFEYVSNLHPPSLPIGFDVEALPAQVLRKVAGVATLPSHREHVTLYIREKCDTFRFGNVSFGRVLTEGRFVIDHPQDYDFFQRLYALIPDSIQLTSVYELLNLAALHPEISALNSSIDRYEGVRKSVGKEGRKLNL